MFTYIVCNYHKKNLFKIKTQYLWTYSHSQTFQFKFCRISASATIHISARSSLCGTTRSRLSRKWYIPVNFTFIFTDIENLHESTQYNDSCKFNFSLQPIKMCLRLWSLYSNFNDIWPDPINTTTHKHVLELLDSTDIIF